MIQVEIVEIESSLGFILPQELVSRLRVKDGDCMVAVVTTGGVVLLPPK